MIEQCNSVQRWYRFFMTHRLVSFSAFTLIIVIASSMQTLQQHQTIAAAATTVKVHGMVVEATAGQTTYLLTPNVAVFSDTNTSSTASDFSSTINWGDSIPTTSGRISVVGWAACQPWEPHSPKVNCFKIDSNSEHTYKNPPTQGGLYHITVTVTKSDGQKIVPGQAFAEIVAPLGNPPNPNFKQSIGVITIRYSTADQHGATVYSCTATALADVNVVLTARHCFPGWRPTSQFVEIQFAPAHSGQCNFNEDLKQCGGNPDGVWSTTHFSDVHMATDTLESHDAAFIVMNQQSNNGEYLTNALMSHTGFPGLPVTFNAFPNLSWTAFGYPTGYAKGYSPGQKTSWNLHSCGILKGNRLGPNKLGPNMTELDPNNFWISPCQTLGVDKYQNTAGASGGPWISNQYLPNGIGATIHYFCITSNNCSGQLPSDTLIGPPLDHTEMNLYIQAVKASGTITPGGTITEYPISTSGSNPDGIAPGPDGNLWFTESQTNKIGKISTGGKITEHLLRGSNSFPNFITAGSDGNLWFTEYSANKIGKITTGGTITEYLVPTGGSGLNGITAGPDGNLWFTEATANKIGKITTGGTITEYPIPTSGSTPQEITAGRDGNLWFTEYSANKIGKITTGGTITEYPIPTSSSSLNGITAGPDGNLWFTESTANKIGKMTTGGTITEYPIPTSDSHPINITAGSDGNLWFTEIVGNKIGKITP